MTAEVAVPGETAVETEAAEDGPAYCGQVILEWPAPVRSSGFLCAMVAWKVSVFDASDGSPIHTVEAFTLRANADGWVAADMTMLARPDGTPLLSTEAEGGIYPDGDGGFLKGTFPFLVAEMRVRQP